MTHTSALRLIVIDCQTDDLTGAAAFWSAALGGEADIDADGKYARILGQAGPAVLLQAVDHAPRVHMDIESDDQAAEVARLEALGAKVVAEIKSWTVMEAPTGHRFCIVAPQDDSYSKTAKTRT
jgi:predicted enzyme related to lactoylglutathione lyase